MSIKYTSKLIKFFTFSTISFLISLLAFVLSKKEESGYPSFSNYNESIVHADVPCSPCGCAYTVDQCTSYSSDGGGADGGDGSGY